MTPGASVAPETRALVMAAAEQLGYRPNLLARSLMTRRSKVIALLMGQLRNPFYSEMLGVFTEQLRLKGYQTILHAVAADFSLESAVEASMQYQLDGLMMVSCSPSDELAARCRRLRMPVVVIDRQSVAGTNQVWIDSERLGREVAELLLREGRRRFAIIEGSPSDRLSRRARAFMERVRQEGCSVTIDYGSYSHEGGGKAARRLLRQQPRPDGLFCVSDLMALGALDAIRNDDSTSVSTGLSVVGFSDVEAAAWPPYELTTARLPIKRLVEASVQMMMRRIDDPEQDAESCLIHCPIIERRTTLLRVSD